jgi:hypothetical protein
VLVVLVDHLQVQILLQELQEVLVHIMQCTCILVKILMIGLQLVVQVDQERNIIHQVVLADHPIQFFQAELHIQTI